MSQAPSMPVFVDALIGDTMDLSAEEFGAYCLILFATWRNNGKPLIDDDRRMARICRSGIKKWRRMRPILEPFFEIENGVWFQKRLQKEWDVVQLYIAQKSHAAITRWRKTKETGDADAYAGDAVPHMHPTPTLKEERETKVSLVKPPSRFDPFESMVGVWRAECGHVLAVPAKPIPSRKQKAASRWRDSFRADLDRWREFCRCVAETPFLCGENDRAWKADFDWVLEPKHLAQIEEGKYGARRLSNGHDKQPYGPDEPAPKPEDVWGHDYGGAMDFSR